MTADLVEGGRERCLEAGMNDYLSKPFKAEELRDILEKWLVLPEEVDLEEEVPDLPEIDLPGAVSEPISIPAIPPMKSSLKPEPEPGQKPEQKPSIDQAVLNSLKMLQEEGGPDILHEFINLYLDDAPGLIKKIQEAVAQCDCAALRLNAHTLKSSSGLLDATVLSDICKALEYRGTVEDTDNISELAHKMGDEYKQVEVQLSSQLERAS